MKYYLGLDVGGTNLAAGVVSEQFQIISKAAAPSGRGKTIEEMVHTMAEVSREALRKARLGRSDIAYWGIGMPSYVNPKTKLLVHANCFGWRNIPILDYLSKETDLPVLIENDANCAAYGEILAGAGRYFENAIVLTLGTGVGGGIILNRKIYAGADSMGGELGHTKLVFDGKQCTCGQYGCMESYCSARALNEMAVDALKDPARPQTILWDFCQGDLSRLTVKHIFDAEKEGDPLAMGLTDQYVKYLAAGISTFVVIFRPEIIILGGGVSNAGDSFFRKVNAALMEETFAANEIGVPNVIRAELGNDAGIIGAAMLGLNK